MKIYIERQWSYWERQGVRGPKPTIGKFGNGTDFMDIQRGTITPHEWVEKYGKLSGAYFGFKPSLIVSDVEIVKEVTIKEGFGLEKGFPRNGPYYGLYRFLNAFSPDADRGIGKFRREFSS